MLSNTFQCARYKAYDIANKKWIGVNDTFPYEEVLCVGSNHAVLINYTPSPVVKTLIGRDFDDLIIVGSTGLLDKFGNIIYEGDILQMYNGNVYEVLWNISEGRWETKLIQKTPRPLGSSLIDTSDIKSLAREFGRSTIIGSVIPDKF